MNNVILTGRLAQKPEISYTPSQKAVVRFALAVSKGKDKGADFIDCVAWERTAELINSYGDKGRKVAIQGKLTTGGYEKQGIKIKTTDVVVSNCEFLDSAKPQEPKAEPYRGTFDENPLF